MHLSAIIIEDEKLVAWSLAEHLKSLGMQVAVTEFAREGIEMALKDPPDFLFVDYRLPDLDGIEVLRSLQTIRDQSIFFFMTAYGTEEVSIEALRLGATEYLTKPVNFEEITLFIDRALRERNQSKTIHLLKECQRKTLQLGAYVSRSRKMQEIMQTVHKLRDVEAGTILLLGETGTGKDTFARLIHEHSPRRHKPFIVVNCTALSEHLLESELFGHEKGAFTDAKSRKPGQVELAEGGTVYLDEIAEIPISFQAKLLRFIETRSFYRVGGTRELKVNVRIIASTNRDLKHEMEQGRFREDLFYRLNVIALTLPPLRERVEDIPLLVEHFIKMFNVEFKCRVEGIDPDALEMLKHYDWPGNVRELKNTIERIFLLEQPRVIHSWHFPASIRQKVDFRPREFETGVQSSDDFFDGKTLADVEREMVEWALRQKYNNQTHAAQLLGISRDQLRYKMKKYGLLD